MDYLTLSFALSCSPLSLSLIDTALSLVPEQTELLPWLSPVLVLPVLQLLSCSGLIEPLADRRTHSLNQDLAHGLLRSISRETDKPRQVTLRLVLKPFLSCPPLDVISKLKQTGLRSKLRVFLWVLIGYSAAQRFWLLPSSAGSFIITVQPILQKIRCNQLKQIKHCYRNRTHKADLKLKGMVVRSLLTISVLTFTNQHWLKSHM